jgi:hypothetical protein
VNREDAHRAWAPVGEPWSAWVKPVLFASLAEEVTPAPLTPAPPWLRKSAIEPLAQASPVAADPRAHPYRADQGLRDTALVIDLPGEAGTLAGVAFVAYGFRPIPLYNAVPGPGALVDLRPIMRVLVDGTQRVAAVPPGAPPAFLLDADRMRLGHAVVPGSFDNRSICRESDFPSAETLLQAQIRRALLIRETTARPAVDLASVLFAWQKRGIALWRLGIADTTPAAPFKLGRPFWLRRLAHDVRSFFLSQREDKTFGMFVGGPTSG